MHATEQGIDNAEFVQGSVYELNFPDASFDVCTLFSMIETLDDPLAGIDEARRVLKPGGAPRRLVDPRPQPEE